MLLGKYLKKYYKQYALMLILGIIFLAIVDIANLYIPDLTGQLVGLFVENYDPESVAASVATLSLKVLVIAVAMFFGRILFRLFLFKASTGIGNGLRQELFEKAERLDQSYYHTVKVGNIMSWITSDTEEIQEYFGWGTVMLVDGIFMTVLCIIKMLIKNWIMTLFILPAIILIIVWGLLVEKIMASLWMKRQSYFDKLYEFCEESFSGIRVIKAFIKESIQLVHFSKVAKENKDADIKLGVTSVSFDVVIEIIIQLVIALIIGVGGFFIYSAAKKEPVYIFSFPLEIKTADLVTFLNYFLVLVWPLIALGSVITMHSRAKASYQRIEKFLDAEEVIINKENAIELKDIKGKIEFRDLTFGYPNTNDTKLSHISLTINPGENIGVVGRVGSGKTTLVYLLTKMYNVKEGTLFFDDNDIMDCTFESVRKNVAAVPQDNFLFSLTVEENIKFGNSDASFEQVKEAAEFSSVAQDVEGFANKYETKTGERGLSLSGGQKQRIAIARAFIKNSPIMIFDDSVSAVDIHTEKEILDNIKKQRAGKTTIIISSRVSTINQLDKIIVLNNGELEAFDTPENLLKVSPTYKKMVYLQKLEDELKEAN